MLLIGLALAECPVMQVLPDGNEVLRPFGDAWVPVASLVRPVGACEGGQQVELVSPVLQYQQHERPHAQRGLQACLPNEALGPSGSLFIHQESGAVHDCCHCVGEHDRPLTVEQLGRIHRVRDAYQALFGEVNLAWIRVTEWGKVGLPLRWFSDAEIAEQHANEGFVTDLQKEKSLVAEGGNYLHFLGSDAPYSDIWGDEDFIIELMHLAHGFSDPERPQTTVQFGDISYYNRQLPDPLGHADHYLGTCVDIRLFREDASRYEAYWNQPDDREGDWLGYSAELTYSFTAFLRGRSPNKLFFNDPADPVADFWRGHDDHIHYCQDADS
jgi:hypothetical protein